MGMLQIQNTNLTNNRPLKKLKDYEAIQYKPSYCLDEFQCKLGAEGKKIRPLFYRI